MLEIKERDSEKGKAVINDNFKNNDEENRRLSLLVKQKGVEKGKKMTMI